jgi:hypothetical protein
MNIFSRFSIFKTPTHKRFDPIPRFYNPDKEYIDGKMNKHKSEEDGKYSDIRNNIRNNFRNNKAGFGTSHLNRGKSSRSTIRLIIILVLLITITYYILTRYFSNIETLIK